MTFLQQIRCFCGFRVVQVLWINMCFFVGHEKCILVAHDWGGIVAWNFVSTYPEMVDRLIVCNGPHLQTFGKYLRTHLSQFRKSWQVGNRDAHHLRQKINIVIKKNYKKNKKNRNTFSSLIQRAKGLKIFFQLFNIFGSLLLPTFHLFIL